MQILAEKSSEVLVLNNKQNQISLTGTIQIRWYTLILHFNIELIVGNVQILYRIIQHNMRNKKKRKEKQKLKCNR